MGPSISVDGDVANQVEVAFTDRALQWGRRSASTETGAAGGRPPACPGFNGAVDQRRRRRFLDPLAFLALPALQWGRRSASTETGSRRAPRTGC